jgi:hypothetical protein
LQQVVQGFQIGGTSGGTNTSRFGLGVLGFLFPRRARALEFYVKQLSEFGVDLLTLLDQYLDPLDFFVEHVPLRRTLSGDGYSLMNVAGSGRK